MTGACFASSFIYLLGTNYSGAPVVARFTTTGTVSVYMTSFPGLSAPYYDIAWLDGGGFWVARDNSDSPILAYNSIGELAGHIPGSLVSEARGLAIDSSGYLWASNPGNETIYKIDLSTGIHGEGSTPDQIRLLSADRNPVTASVVITGTGFSGASLEIFDVFGRRIESSPFTGTYLWNASGVAHGIYFVRVSDAGGTRVLKLVRTDSR